MGPEKEVGVEKEIESKFLTEKAVKLLRVIAEHGYLTINEVGLIYKHQTHAYRVAKGLKELGLIEEFDTQLRPRTGYVLQAKGYRLLKERGQLRLERRFKLEDYKTFIFNHRMACAKVGLVLEEHPGVKEFAPESLLWERRRDASAKLCDGEFWFQAAGWSRPRRVGLEVELTVKNREKLEESFRGLMARRDLDQVWWICGDAKVEKVVRHWIAGRAGARQQHFMCDLAEFLSRRFEVEFHDWAGNVATITPAGATMPERAAEPKPAPLPPPAAAAEPASAGAGRPLGLGIQPRLEDRYKERPRPAFYSEPPPSPRPRSWDEPPRCVPPPWREYLVLGLMVCGFCAYAYWLLAPVAGPWLDSERVELSDILHPPPPPPQPRAWRNRTPFNNAWNEPTWGFRLDRLESSGDMFRMKLRTRLRGWLGDQCAIKGLSIASPVSRVLAQWDITPPISGAQGWTSLSLVFHAPPKTGELYVGFQLQPEWCRAWQWPVGVR